MSDEATDVAPQWEPTPSDIANARITDFGAFVQRRGGAQSVDYPTLWQWSIDNVDEFWKSVWAYFEIGSPEPEVALASSEMPGAVWFPGTQLNYVDQIRRNARTDRPAIIYSAEDGSDTELSWSELLRQTAALAATLRDLGVGTGDRVAGYLPNIPEAVVAFLATASIGAVWSACGQDYSAPAALTRLGQLEPSVLIAADGYRFGGKTHDRRAEVAQLRAGMPSVRTTILVSRLESAVAGTLEWSTATSGEHELSPVPVDFDHPLWIVFSSGTTGLPKGIVHGHGGVVLEHLKAIALHSDLGAEDTFFCTQVPVG